LAASFFSGSPALGGAIGGESLVKGERAREERHDGILAEIDDEDGKVGAPSADVTF
jgi:hypothetical protein